VEFFQVFVKSAFYSRVIFDAFKDHGKIPGFCQTSGFLEKQMNHTYQSAKRGDFV